MKTESSELTPLYARYLVHMMRPFPNFDVSFIKPVRAEAIRRLSLQPGDHVLDVGCGLTVSKLSFDSTPLPESDPWRLVARRLESIKVQEYFFATMFLAWGVLAKR
ncbi:MAG: hypothetical protein ABL921_07410 [Pirellula sp.]